MKPTLPYTLLIVAAASAIVYAGGARAADPPAAQTDLLVKPLDWLKAQKPPDFPKVKTLAPLTRWG